MVMADRNFGSAINDFFATVKFATTPRLNFPINKNFATLNDDFCVTTALDKVVFF